MEEILMMRDKLEATKSQTLHYFTLSEEHLMQQYRQDSWTVRQILHHMADAESVLLHRIKQAIAGVQLVWAFDQDAWCQHLGYEEHPLNISEQLYTSCRQNVLWLWDRAYDTSQDTTFIHSETGHRTLRQEFDKVVWHNQHHLNQIELALEHLR